MNQNSQLPRKDSDKIRDLRSAYADFQSAMQSLRDERLDFLKSTFARLDEQKMEQTRKELESE
jgi:hypothetical protein